MKKALTLAFVLSIILSVSLLAQESGNLPLSGNPPAKSSFSLLDPSRLHMTQSYTFAYSSSKYGSQSLGLYLNSLEYQISDPLKIRLDLAYLHDPSTLIGNSSSALNNGKLLPGISLSWKPSKNLFFQFNYREVPAYQYNNGYYPDYLYNNFDSGR